MKYIFLWGGGAKYYMGEEGYDNLNFHAFRIQKLFYGQLYPIVPEDELLNIYGIRLISFEPSDPIVNTFK